MLSMDNFGNFSLQTEKACENISGILQLQISLEDVWDMPKTVQNFPQHFLPARKIKLKVLMKGLVWLG